MFLCILIQNNSSRTTFIAVLPSALFNGLVHLNEILSSIVY